METSSPRAPRFGERSAPIPRRGETWDIASDGGRKRGKQRGLWIGGLWDSKAAA